METIEQMERFDNQYSSSYSSVLNGAEGQYYFMMADLSAWAVLTMLSFNITLRKDWLDGEEIVLVNYES